MTLAQDLARRGRPAVTAARTPHLDFSARLHRRALPSSFFAGLGAPFLRAYHESFLASPHAVALTAWSDGRPAGFLVGTLANGAHYRWVVRHRGAQLARSGVLALVARPGLALYFLRTRVGRYARALLRAAAAEVRRSTGRRSEAAASEHVAVLTHVAVSEATRGQGAGAALVDTFTEAASSSGATEAQLVTAAGSPGTHAFYRRCGWRQREDRPDHDGRIVTRFVRRLG